MGWNPDRPPIEYLERRVKYYHKKIAKIKAQAKDPWFIEKYGKAQLLRVIRVTVAKQYTRIKEFEDAIKKLKS